MPELSETRRTIIAGLYTTTSEELPLLFKDYDTVYWENSLAHHYDLPKGKVIVIVLFSTNELDYSHIWTTIRRWTPRKEIYYRGLVGHDVDILINVQKT